MSAKLPFGVFQRNKNKFAAV